MKRNLTLQLDDDVIRQAKVLAARRGTSVSALVAHEVQRLIDESRRYEESWRRAREVMAGAVHRGGREWSRGELYDR